MKEVIEKALDIVANKMTCDENLVFSEADFERLLANTIEEVLGTRDVFCVNTQVSLYESEDNDTIRSLERKCYPKQRTDIVILNKLRLDESKTDSVNKGLKYAIGEAHAIEVKYLKKNDSSSLVRGDFEKYNEIISEMDRELTFNYYVVVLIKGGHRNLNSIMHDELTRSRNNIENRKQINAYVIAPKRENTNTDPNRNIFEKILIS